MESTTQKSELRKWEGAKLDEVAYLLCMGFDFAADPYERNGRVFFPLEGTLDPYETLMDYRKETPHSYVAARRFNRELWRVRDLLRDVKEKQGKTPFQTMKGAFEKAQKEKEEKQDGRIEREPEAGQAGQPA